MKRWVFLVLAALLMGPLHAAPIEKTVLPNGLEQVDAARVQAVARRYLAPDRMKVVAVGLRATVAPQLRKLQLGAVEVRDTEGQLP